MPPADAFYKDILHSLQRYATGVDDALSENLATFGESGFSPQSPSSEPASPLAAGGSTSPRNSRAGRRSTATVKPRRSIAGSISPEEAEARARREERTKIMRATERYRSALAREHARALQARLDLAETHMEARREELEMARRHYGENSGTNLDRLLQDQLSDYLEELHPRELLDDHGKPTNPEAEAQREWSREVCKVVVQDLRQEWRTAQKKILLAIARDLRHEHQAAADIMEKSLQSWQQVQHHARVMWDGELKKVQEQLDKLAEGYKKALQVLYEAELREVKQHIVEQADFFRGEIRDAEKAELVENERNAAQIRRMQTAVLKWRHDYLRDAEQQAREVAARRRLRYLDGVDPWEDVEDDEETTGLKVSRPKAKVGFEEAPEDQVDDDLEEQAERMIEDIMVDSGISSIRQRAIQAGMKRAIIRRLQGQQVASTLKRSRNIVSEIHEKLPADPAEVRVFLLKLEESVPATADVLRIYEEHLAEHGVVAALAAHRPSPSPSEVANGMQDGLASPSPSQGSESVGLSPRRRHMQMRGSTGARRGRGFG